MLTKQPNKYKTKVIMQSIKIIHIKQIFVNLEWQIPKYKTQKFNLVNVRVK